MFTTQDSTRPDEYPLTAVGARRRLEALAAIGHPPTDLAELLNLERGAFAFWHLEVPPYKYAELARLFSRLELTPGPSKQARTHAAAHGWAPPLAWDEDTIDDPDAEPQGVRPGYRRQVPPDFVDMVLESRDLGHYDEQIAEAMGIKLDAFSRRLHRLGLPERRHGNGTSIHRPPAYGNRYRLRLHASADRLQDFAGVVRSAS